MRNVLITMDEVVFHAPTKHTLDPRMINNSIIIAEERLIRTALGYDFYFAICNQKNQLITDLNRATLETTINTSLPSGATPVTLVNGDIVNALEFLTAENIALWKQYLWKLVAECVMLSAYPEGFIQFSTEGTVHGAPPAGPMTTDKVVSPDLKSVRWGMDKKMMDRIDPLRESMHLWLCKQKALDNTKYTLYTKPCDCNADGVAFKRKTDVIMGLYDDVNDPNCRPCKVKQPFWSDCDNNSNV